MLVGWLLNNAGDMQGFPVAVPCRTNQVAVHRSDELERYFLGTRRFTLAMIRTTAEVFVCHGDHHAESPLIALRLTLRKRVEVGNFGGREKHGSSIRTGGDTSSAADAGSSIKRRIRGFFLDQDRIRIVSASRGSGDETACLNDPVKGRPINDQIPEHWESTGAPGLERERVVIPEKTHGELAHGGAPLASVGHSVDQETARPADPLSAIVIEGNRRLLPPEEAFIESVEHLEERHVRRHVLYFIRDESPQFLCALLPPNPQSKVHGYL
jgi:hypothetical protein